MIGLRLVDDLAMRIRPAGDFAIFRVGQTSWRDIGTIILISRMTT